MAVAAIRQAPPRLAARLEIGGQPLRQQEQAPDFRAHPAGPGSRVELRVAGRSQRQEMSQPRDGPFTSRVSNRARPPRRVMSSPIASPGLRSLLPANLWP